MASAHFRVEELAPGVFVARALDVWAACNAGIIDLGDATLVFDALQTPQAAAELRAACIARTGRPPAYVVNSHWHSDHTWGTEALARGAQVVATERTRALMASRGQAELERQRVSAPARLAQIQERLAGEGDPQRRRELGGEAARLRAVVAALPGLSLILPTRPFDGRLVLAGPARRVELAEFAGHTASDAVLHLPGEGLVFAGDLLVVGFHPYVGDGDPDRWRESLRQLRALRAAAVVPGHGPVGAGEELDVLGDYLAELEARAAALAAAGADGAEAARAPIPPPYDRWRLPGFFHRNLAFLARKAGKDPGPHSPAPPA